MNFTGAEKWSPAAQQLILPDNYTHCDEAL